VGQLNLHPLLKAPQMRQLDQRVSIRYELKPLTRDEAAAYVNHRLTIAGGSSVVSFDAKALTLVHRRASGIPRLVNLLCDRALLAAYSARTNKVTADMVQKAAESLELVSSTSTRFGWLRKRASVLVTAVAAIASLAVVGGLLPQVVRAATKQRAVPAVRNIPARAVTAPPPAPVEVAAAAPLASGDHYAVLAASFPIKEVTDGSPAAVRLDALAAQLRALGYRPRVADITVQGRGEWRRLLIGNFDTLDDAVQQAKQLHDKKEFADAQPIRF
jgi:general secretion pathway protein A